MHAEIRFWPLAASAHLMLSAGLLLRGIQGTLSELVFLIASNLMTAFGLSLMVATVRSINRDWRLWQADLAFLIFTVVMMTVVVLGPNNNYEIRVTLMSGLIVAISGTIAILAFSALKKAVTADAVIFVFFGAFGTAVSLGRLMASVAQDAQGYLNLLLWDKVFFLWSLPATFIFAAGVFTCGARLTLEKSKLAESQQRLLSQKLKVSIEEQYALRKLILHEVRRPISTISTLLQNSQRYGEFAQRKHFEQLRLLVGEANRYLDGIGEYDEISDLIANREPTNVKLSDFLQDIRRKWNIQVDGAIASQTEVFEADIFLLSIALDNMIENALKFCRITSEVKLTISHNDQYLFFDVSDDGEGVLPQYQQQIFQRFFKAPSTLKSSKAGSGLGLYISIQIAEAHGGHSCVLSQTPSVIRLALPFQRGQAQ